MKRFLIGFGLGLAGIAFALGLTLGALAVAGPDVGDPPTPPSLEAVREPSPSPSDDGREDDGRDDRTATPTPTAAGSPSADDGAPPSNGGGDGDPSDPDDDRDDEPDERDDHEDEPDDD